VHIKAYRNIAVKRIIIVNEIVGHASHMLELAKSHVTLAIALPARLLIMSYLVV
jgi:hypothetical protein